MYMHMNTQTLRKKKQHDTTQDLRRLFPKEKLHLGFTMLAELKSPIQTKPAS